MISFPVVHDDPAIIVPFDSLKDLILRENIIANIELYCFPGKGHQDPPNVRQFDGGKSVRWDRSQDRFASPGTLQN